jgi:omega-6 fatty acid desaturase (delta-12 desaturase)
MTNTQRKEPARPSWRAVVAPYEHPSLRSSVGQLATSVIPYFALLCAMYFALDVSYWLSLVLAVPAAGFLTRVFIIFHDCGHGSFFRSKRANRVVGFFTALLTFIPSYYWSHEHARHHSSAGDLDGRGKGDVWTLTVREYIELPWWQRLRYRLYRNPLVMFGVGPAYTFLIHYRFWRRGDGARAKWSTIKTNAVLAAIVLAMSLTIGLKTYLMIQIPVLVIAATAGVWLFYVQHQFEGTYWERHDRWSYVKQALEGSSYYKLPRVLQWFTGNIGFHHVHHLSPRVPNYHLQKCHEGSPIFEDVKHITLWSSFRSLSFRLWDEERKKLVGFRDIAALPRVRAEG